MSSVVFDNKLWVAGAGNGEVFNNDVWYSENGIDWTRATKNAAWPGRESHTSVAFDGKMWIIGGRTGTGLFGDVWFSEDGVNWTEAVPTGDMWTARVPIGVVVYNGRIWVMGGTDNLDTGAEHNDVWSTKDGINWIEDEPAGWEARQAGHAVVHDNKIWVTGGLVFANFTFRSDTWYGVVQ